MCGFDTFNHFDNRLGPFPQHWFASGKLLNSSNDSKLLQSKHEQDNYPELLAKSNTIIASIHLI